MDSEHNIDNGADCWCEPKIIIEGENRIFVHKEKDKNMQELTKDSLLEVFKMYSFEEITATGKQCFVVDVDGFLTTACERFGKTP